MIKVAKMPNSYSGRKSAAKRFDLLQLTTEMFLMLYLIIP